MAESSNGKPENSRELLEAVEPESILPRETRPGDRNVLHSLFSSRDRVTFVGDRVPAWWTPERDKWLWRLLLGSDVLSSAVFSTCARLASVPVHVYPYEPDNRNSRRLSGWSDMLLRHYWTKIAFQVALDWQTQDNGTFIEIMGDGPPGGPIEPSKVPGTNDYVYGTGLRVLDSQCATRTRDETYPVVYRHIGGDGVEKTYKFHKSRIIYLSQMPTTRRDMLGVGYCGTARCVRNVIRLDDINTLEDEMLGARPMSQIVFTRAISAEDVEGAFERAEEKMDVSNAEQRKRSARTVFVSATGPPEMVRAASMETFDLKKMPEGYSAEVYMNLAINVISMSLGFDPREIWPATVRGATRADAEVQHWKSMRKTPGLWIDAFKQQLGEKWTPSSCYIEFDQQDDEQDAMRADLKNKRALTRQIQIESGQIDHAVMWQQMLEDGDITESQLELLVNSEEIKIRMEKLRLEAELIRSQIGLTDNQAEAELMPAAPPPAPAQEEVTP